jgi:hypothetical protein
MIIEERTDVYTQVEKYNLSNSIVLLSSGTSVIRPMPSGDLTRNDFDYRNDILFAIDDDRYNDALMKHFPSRSFYKYVRDKENKTGKLIPVRTNHKEVSPNP